MAPIPIPLSIRFDRHVTRLPEAPGCWLWTGKIANMGYGRIRIGPAALREHNTHRAAYELFVGPIPAGMSVLHKCDVRSCVRPDHLYLGTQLENMRDISRRGAFKRKLTWPKVQEIRRLRGEGLSTLDLASQFNVSPQMIRRIVSGRNWSPA